MVMQTINGLEESFSVRLFHRTTRSFSLTEQGAKLHEYAGRMVSEFEDACGDLRSDAVEPKGKLTLQIPGVLLDVPALHSILSRFLKKYPQVVFEVLTQDRVGDLVDRQVDIALHVGPLVDSSYIALLVHKFGTYILASKEYLQEHKKPSHPSELERHKVVNYRHCLTGDKWIFREPGTENYLPFFIGKATKVDDERLLISFASSGEGIASALDISCVSQINSGQLQLMLEDWTYDIPLYLVYASRKSMPKSQRLLIEALMQELPAALKVEINVPKPDVAVS
jgi:DNA-binding transcriptional LysR family regulator